MPVVPNVPVWASVAIGLWFVVIAYEFLLFGYFLILKALRLWSGGQRQKANTEFYLFFAVFFLLLAIGRGFFIVWDFYVLADPAYLWVWRIGEMFQWIALTFISLAITTRVFENRFIRDGIPIVPGICALFYVFLPDDILLQGSSGPVLAALNFVIAPLFAIVIPAIYLYVAIRSAGVIRNSALFLAGGFLIYYLGRVLHTIFVSEATNVAALLLAPGIVIIGLLIMTVGAVLMK